MTQTSYVAGLIGSGVGTSLTPPMHEREGTRHGLAYVYRVVDISALGIPPESVTELVAAARLLGFDGLNITHPCKQLVMDGLDDISPEARSLGAVNTVVFAGGQATGHNTDVTGFSRSFGRGLPDAAMGTVIQVGAGGAGAAVAHALCRLGVERLIISDLDPGRARALVAGLRSLGAAPYVDSLDRSRIAEALRTADGIVNATPMGMTGHHGSAVPTEALEARHWVADIVYRPLRTPLIRAARARGCRVLTGAGMAVFQAVEAFHLITGRSPDPRSMLTDFAELVSDEDATRTEGAIDA